MDHRHDTGLLVFAPTPLDVPKRVLTCSWWRVFPVFRFAPSLNMVAVIPVYLVVTTVSARWRCWGLFVWKVISRQIKDPPTSSLMLPAEELVWCKKVMNTKKRLSLGTLIYLVVQAVIWGGHNLQFFISESIGVVHTSSLQFVRQWSWTVTAYAYKENIHITMSIECYHLLLSLNRTN